ncbi:MAG: type IV pilus modification protein PilV [Motiliproteus sp.]|nr:type IV pilus modification protein PilV [Motiliproteus sp.]MCW9052316.1 type IV pilus modification protein PilV [Motiliproteus sp.]
MVRTDQVRAAGKERGFTLIEVLVAVAVLSIGIFGLIALEGAALKNNQDAYVRSQVTVLIYDITDKMRSNMAADYTAAASTSTTSCVSYSGSTSGCTSAQIAQRDLFDWHTNIGTIVPNGAGTITASGSVMSVTISWDDDRDASTAVESISMSFEL